MKHGVYSNSTLSECFRTSCTSRQKTRFVTKFHMSLGWFTVTTVTTVSTVTTVTTVTIAAKIFLYTSSKFWYKNSHRNNFTASNSEQIWRGSCPPDSISLSMLNMLSGTPNLKPLQPRMDSRDSESRDNSGSRDSSGSRKSSDIIDSSDSGDSSDSVDSTEYYDS